MVMKKTFSDMNATLESLKLEFEAFRQSGQALQVSKPVTPGHLCLENELPDATLYCSKKIGERSSLKLRATESTLEVIAAETANRRMTDNPPTDGDRASIQKRPLEVSGSYRGCPHCGSNSMARCSNSGVLGCWSDSEQNHRCAVCGQTAIVERTGIEIIVACHAGKPGSLRSKLKQLQTNPAKRLLLPKRTPED
jgi:hypothetical protein